MSSDHPRSRGVYGQASGSCSPPSGSSPLARGLRGPRSRSTPRTGIIPARAGFTVKRGPAPRPGRDHPRSRGVYDDVGVVGGCEEGSSPLARGLQAGTGSPLAIRGIIPARAGFTPSGLPQGSRPRDHPRSRGVYDDAIPQNFDGCGSSPLARGLRTRSSMKGPNWRIIPARAGFTDQHRPRHRPCPDHPRSRGVYPPDLPCHADVLRIIPARAGFTPLLHGVRHRNQDHPRSRGVYSPTSPPASAASGSSPLARGLHDVLLIAPVDGRIIPARAGFTRVFSRAPVRIGDHPRSRGVYHDDVPSLTHVVGSSPLARGLPVAPQRLAGRVRIIPARAGFTGPSGSPDSTGRDHPRSRGVYSIVPSTGFPSAGSSPLARGLPSGGGARSRRRADHPRSRGVYRTKYPRQCNRRGSSPLARGLLCEELAAEQGVGIIPARAGFTTGPTPSWWAHPDHPRLRGVYGRAVGGAYAPQGSSPLARGLRWG